MTKPKLPLFLRLLAVLIAGAALGYLLLCASFLLPAKPIADNVRASVPAINGEWGSGEESYEQLVKGYLSTQLDNSTDMSMMLSAAHESDESPMQRALNAYTYVTDGNAYKAFIEFGEGKELISASISRYWHGYLIILKPLLSLLSYMDIRVLLMMVQGALLIGVVAGLSKRGLGNAVWAFGLSLLCITPAITGFSLQFSTTLIVFLTAMLVLLHTPSERLSGTYLPMFFTVCGMAACYFDYLTYPIAAFGMPFTAAVLLKPESTAKLEWKRFIICGICWAFGYFGIWAMKWLLVIVFGNEQWFLPNLLAKISERSSHETSEFQLSYGLVLKSVFGVFAKRSYLIAAAATAIAVCVLLVKRIKCGAALSGMLGSIGGKSVLFAVAALPFIWYFFTQNHSYQHAFFTSRGLCVSVFALVSALAPRRTHV